MKCEMKEKCKKCTYMGNRCGGCTYCEGQFCNDQCEKCDVLCHSRPTSIAYLKNELEGAEFELIAQPEIKLPSHVPILPDRLKAPVNVKNNPVVAVHAGNMFARNGMQVNKSYIEKGFTGALNLHSDTEGILEFYVKDRTLEGFWDKRHEIYPELKKLKFKAVISPNFSVYEDAPRLDHLHNIKRTAIVYNEMIELGLPAVPDVSWFQKEDLDIWIREINDKKIKTISFSFQTVDVRMKASNIYRTYLTGFKYLCDKIENDVSIVIAGVSSNKRVEEIHAICDQKLCILNQSSFVQSRRGMLSKGRMRAEHLSLDQIFTENLKYFNDHYEELNVRKGETHA